MAGGSWHRSRPARNDTPLSKETGGASTAVLAAWVMGQVLMHGVAPVARERLRAVLRPGTVITDR